MWFAVWTDTTAPVITCPAGVTVEGNTASGAGASLQAVVDFLAGPSATDAVDPTPTLSNDKSSLDPWPFGATTTIFTATDDDGNSATCAAVLTVAGAGSSYTCSI